MSSAEKSSSTVFPATYDIGKISKVNLQGRFVVITFPIASVPQVEQRLHVYRKGLKIAELKVSGPQQENNTVADIISGEPQLNDEVRAD